MKRKSRRGAAAADDEQQAACGQALARLDSALTGGGGAVLTRGGVDLTAEDKRLWQEVARTVLPLRHKALPRARGKGAEKRRKALAPQTGGAAAPGTACGCAPSAQPVHQSAHSAATEENALMREAYLRLANFAHARQHDHARQHADTAQAGAALRAAADLGAANAEKAAAENAARRAGLSPLDGGSYRRLARGRAPIEARLDLHEHTQSQAHDALLCFVRGAQARGCRHALIITGKGRSLGSEGVLQRQMPHWLAAAPFRLYIAAYAQAAPAHGGAGGVLCALAPPPLKFRAKRRGRRKAWAAKAKSSGGAGEGMAR